ncbi:MAG: VOC family protein [Oscillospiraceae bacterium]|nr:VOC family protein [Oscillospiraceae bacterium]
MANKKIPNIGVHHLALSAVDFDKSIKFYTEGLGFEIVAEWGEGAGRAALLDIGSGSHFEIFANGNSNEQQDVKFVHFAFATTNPDLAYENALAAGAASQMEPQSLEIPANPALPVRIAFVRGPDGEVLEFFKVL